MPSQHQPISPLCSLSVDVRLHILEEWFEFDIVDALHLMMEPMLPSQHTAAAGARESCCLPCFGNIFPTSSRKSKPAAKSFTHFYYLSFCERKAQRLLYGRFAGENYPPALLFRSLLVDRTHMRAHLAADLHQYTGKENELCVEWIYQNVLEVIRTCCCNGKVRSLRVVDAVPTDSLALIPYFLTLCINPLLDGLDRLELRCCFKRPDLFEDFEHPSAPGLTTTHLALSSKNTYTLKGPCEQQNASREIRPWKSFIIDSYALPVTCGFTPPYSLWVNTYLFAQCVHFADYAAHYSTKYAATILSSMPCLYYFYVLVTDPKELVPECSYILQGKIPPKLSCVNILTIHHSPASYSHLARLLYPYLKSTRILGSTPEDISSCLSLCSRKLEHLVLSVGEDCAATLTYLVPHLVHLRSLTLRCFIPDGLIDVILMLPVLEELVLNHIDAERMVELLRMPRLRKAKFLPSLGEKLNTQSVIVLYALGADAISNSLEELHINAIVRIDPTASLGCLFPHLQVFGLGTLGLISNEMERFASKTLYDLYLFPAGPYNRILITEQKLMAILSYLPALASLSLTSDVEQIMIDSLLRHTTSRAPVPAVSFIKLPLTMASDLYEGTLRTMADVATSIRIQMR